MDFFKSLVADADEETADQNSHESNDEENVDEDEQSSDDDQASETTGLWSFGGLIETITTRSESVFETYRRDLEEFGTGLKKETDLFREAASKAVKDLPASIDAAHGVIKSTAGMISHGRESLFAAGDEFGGEEKTPESNRGRDSVRYSRFEAQLSAIQNDVKTFGEDPEDLEEFGKWKLGFALIDRGEEIASLIGENGVLEGMHKGIVPHEVDNETFWFRYFYRVHKLQQQESVRANLVRRAISIEDDEELSWDVDDDDDDDDDESVGESSAVKEKGDESVNKEKGVELVNKKDSSDSNANGVEKEGDRKDESRSVSGDNVGENKSNVETASNNNVVELKPSEESEVKNEENSLESQVKNEEKSVKLESPERNEEKSGKLEETTEVKKDEKVEKSEEKESAKGKGDEGGLGKGTAVSAKSSQQSKVEEEELEWDEIEDVDSSDEKTGASAVKKSGQDDLRKRLNTAEEDEDLSWDIEDDD